MRRAFQLCLAVGCLALAACGDPEPGQNDAGNQQQNQSDADTHNYGERPDELEARCEAACDRIYSEDRCDTLFSRPEEDGGGAMSQSACEEECANENLFRGGEWCIATEAECREEPREMIGECLPEDYHPPACDDLGVWDRDYVEVEQEVVELLNQRRTEGVDCGGESFGPVEEVQMDEHLRCAARLHSVDMDEDGYFSTTNPDTGVTTADRAEETEYGGEVLYSHVNSGDRSAEQLVDLNWFEDPEDCQAVMGADYVDVGIGRYDGERWTTIFGAPE